MLEDGDTILRLVGVALILGIVFAGGVVALNFDPPEGESAPDANWTIERVNDSQVRITHAGGDPLRTESLHVTVDGLERAVDFTDPVTPDENVTVPAPEGSVVRVTWEGSGTERETMAVKRV